MRTAFIEQLIIEARSNPRIFLVVGDLGYSVVEPFAAEFPDRFLNSGVAEQNMTGVAAGLASEGYQVFTYSIANFPTFRCAEFIRNDVAYHGHTVTVVSVGGGVAYGALGYSHHAVQDFALMRCLPGVLIAAPGDPVETRAVLNFLSNNPRPSYLRLGKAGEPVVHETPLVDAMPGRFVEAAPRASTDQLILTTGATLGMAVEAWKRRLRTEKWCVRSLPLWGEAEKQIVGEELRGFRRIVTVEEHLEDAGFGSYIREAAASQNLPVHIRSVSLASAVCGKVGSQGLLCSSQGLSCEAIINAATSALNEPWVVTGECNEPTRACHG